MGNSVTRSILLAATVVGLVVSLSACKNETSGLPDGQQATPTGGQSGGGPFTGSNQPGRTTTTPSSPGGPLANIGPCTIVTAADLASFGVGAGKEDLGTPGARECEYTKSGAYVMNVTIYDELGIKDVQGRGELKQLKVGNHEANQGVSAGGICAIAMKITETSRVDVGVAARGNEQEACNLVLPIAQAVEKKLPQG
jgi:hypothetical protein